MGNTSYYWTFWFLTNPAIHRRGYRHPLFRGFNPENRGQKVLGLKPRNTRLLYARR
jgi:hypothetical protein